MSFKVNFWAFSKRPNSTKQPSTTPDNSFDCTLKGPCSIMAPVFEVNYYNAGTDPIGYNYCYVPAFDRYYWVSDWVNDGPIWECRAVEDELATWKTAIGNSSQYILRSSYSFDGTILDNYYPAKTDVRISHSWGLALGSVTGGCYVVGIQNVDSSAAAMGSSRYYVFLAGTSGIGSLLGALFASTTFTNVNAAANNITDEFFKSLFNPMEYITSCMFLPYMPGFENTPLNSLNYGYWNLTGITNCYRVDLSTPAVKSGSFDIARHPEAATRGTYLNGTPFTRYTLTFQPFGQMTIDPALLLDSDDNKLYYNVYTDPISGSATLELSIIANNVTQIIHSQCGQVGVPVNIAQMSTDYMGFVTSTLGAAGGAASSMAMGNIPGVFGSVASGIANAVQSMIPQVQSQGANGSFAAYYATQPFLRAEHVMTVAEDNADRGRPLCRNGTISSYPGYLVIADPDISIQEANRTEMEAIRGFMETGFFYE